MSLEDIIAKAQKKALAKASVAKRAVPVKQPIKSQAKLDPALEAIVQEAAKKAMDKHAKKQEQKAARKKKHIDSVPQAHERIDVARLKNIYSASNFKPMRGYYWFQEPREQNPMIRRSLFSEDMKSATPFGALAILRRKELLSEDNKEPEYQKSFTAFMDRWPDWNWVPGSLAQLTKFTCSYLLGFRSGWDGNAPGHRLCSKHYHVGYEDGKAAAETFENEGLLPKIGVDPHNDETDPKCLDELYRVRGYEREGHIPYEKTKLGPSTPKENRRKKMREIFNGS